MHSIILLLAMTNFIKRIVHRLKQEGCSWYDESGTCGYLRGVAGALHGCSFEENRHHEKISLDTTHLVPAYMVRLASGDVWMLAWDCVRKSSSYDFRQAGVDGFAWIYDCVNSTKQDRKKVYAKSTRRCLPSCNRAGGFACNTWTDDLSAIEFEKDAPYRYKTGGEHFCIGLGQYPWVNRAQGYTNSIFMGNMIEYQYKAYPRKGVALYV